MGIWRSGVGVFDNLLKNIRKPKRQNTYLRDIVTGSFYKVSNLKSGSDLADIRTTIETMRTLARDSQVATALSYYATDATLPNSSGQIIWATDIENNLSDSPAEMINALFKKWQVNNYARDHILELATIGNLYIPTTEMYKQCSDDYMASHAYIGLEHNTILDDDYDIVPSHSIPPENIVHIWKNNERYGFIYDPSESDPDETMGIGSDYVLLPESSVIHFALGGLIGEYSIKGRNESGDEVEYDIQFADPLLEPAVQPTQTLNLLEDSTILSSLIKVVRFVCVECNGADEEEIMPTLQTIKNTIEQQMSLNTGSGDAQSYLNPQSPNNLIYLPRVNGQDPISIIDLNMRDESENSDKLLEYYQDKKLSVLGIPKEALNFSSAEGLGGAGAVMSQRSALYANSLQRIEMAYINGWTDAINKYLISRNLPQYVDQFELHMNPILTEMSTIQFDKRDAAISQAQSIVGLLGDLGVDSPDKYKEAITEIMLEALPKTSASVNDWHMNISQSEDQAM